MSAPGPYVAGLEADGIRHVPLRHATRAFSPASDLRALWELYRLFRRLRPDMMRRKRPPRTDVLGEDAERTCGTCLDCDLFDDGSERHEKCPSTQSL